MSHDDSPPHGPTHQHAHGDRGHAHAHGERDWAEAAARLELEAEVAMPLLGEAVAAIASAVGSPDGVRRVLDLGSGPGVASVLLAQRFPHAHVAAVDASGQLLERVPARAARFAVAERVETRVADLERPLDDIAAAGSIDVVWASMVLHHLQALPGTVADVHRLLRPGGVLAVVELGRRLHGSLPFGLDVGREGFADRHARALAVALTEHLPPGASSLDWPALLADAGFDLVEQRELAMHLPAPLDAAARQLVLEEVQGSARRLQGHLDVADVAVLNALADADDPRCIVHRDDLTLDIVRCFFLARHP